MQGLRVYLCDSGEVRYLLADSQCFELFNLNIGISSGGNFVRAAD